MTIELTNQEIEAVVEALEYFPLEYSSGELETAYDKLTKEIDV